MNDLTTHSPSKSLPTPWVERLFARLSGFYGSKFSDMWGGDPATAKAVWAEELADYSAEEIGRGLAACRSRPWPPTLPEFLLLCRPGLDYERAFLEAVEQMPRRAEGRDQWSSPTVYWAAAKIGNDILSHGYKSIQARWQKAMDEAGEDIRMGRLPPHVPPRLEALPAPGQTYVSAEEARERLAEIKSFLNGFGRTE